MPARRHRYELRHLGDLIARYGNKNLRRFASSRVASTSWAVAEQTFYAAHRTDQITAGDS